jgi:hypothetical protein
MGLTADIFRSTALGIQETIKGEFSERYLIWGFSLQWDQWRS